MIPVFVLTEVRLVRIALAVLLDGIASIRVVGTGDISEDLPPVALTATILVHMRSSVGLEAFRRIAQRHPNARLITLGIPQTKEAILACAEAGVSGFIPTEGSLDDLIETVESVQGGDAMCPPQVASVVLQRIAAVAANGGHGSNGKDVLTPREREIAVLIEQGLSNREIAERLRIALPTVKNHVHHILDKLGLSRRTEIVAAVHAAAHAQESSLYRE